MRAGWCTVVLCVEYNRSFLQSSAPSCARNKDFTHSFKHFYFIHLASHSECLFNQFYGYSNFGV